MDKKELKKLQRNSLILTIGKQAEAGIYATRFGGRPVVPRDFQWPQYADSDLDEVYPINFIVQFNCADLAPCDADAILPEKGMLSFFYDAEGQPFEGRSDCQGCVRVFWFENIEELVLADLPADMDEVSCFPSLSIDVESGYSYPGWEEYELIGGKMSREQIDDYCAILHDLSYEEEYERSKLLGWPDVIQGNMTRNFENCDGGRPPCSDRESLDKWVLLLQLHTIRNDEFELMFGDCGSIYFYIKREDLRKRRFDDVRVVLQC